MEVYRVHQEHDRWNQADYELCWDSQSGTLTYRAEGRENPKDLWGFERSYPPLALDESLFSEIEKIFGREVRDRIVRVVRRSPTV